MTVPSSNEEWRTSCKNLLRRNCIVCSFCMQILRCMQGLSYCYCHHCQHRSRAGLCLGMHTVPHWRWAFASGECIFKKPHNRSQGCEAGFWKLTFICLAASVDLIVLHSYQSCIMYFFIPLTCVWGEDLGFVCKQRVSSYSLSTK